MNAMIFAAGLGTRLRPLTDFKPKALVEVGGRPMIDHVVDRLVEAGVYTIVVNVHHPGQMIVDHLNATGRSDVNFIISDETDMLLDTGGGILKARQFLDGDQPFIVHNADILTDVNLHRMVEAHISSTADVTLLTKERKSSRQLLFDPGTERMLGWTNLTTGEVKPASIEPAGMKMRAFGGIHVISPSVFGMLEQYSAEPRFSIMPFYIDNCKELVIKGYEPTEKYMWHDIGSIDKLNAAEEEMCNGR